MRPSTREFSSKDFFTLSRKMTLTSNAATSVLRVFTCLMATLCHCPSATAIAEETLTEEERSLELYVRMPELIRRTVLEKKNDNFRIETSFSESNLLPARSPPLPNLHQIRLLHQSPERQRQHPLILNTILLSPATEQSSPPPVPPSGREFHLLVFSQ